MLVEEGDHAIVVGLGCPDALISSVRRSTVFAPRWLPRYCLDFAAELGLELRETGRAGPVTVGDRFVLCEADFVLLALWRVAEPDELGISRPDVLIASLRELDLGQVVEVYDAFRPRALLITEAPHDVAPALLRKRLEEIGIAAVVLDVCVDPTIIERRALRVGPRVHAY